MVLHHNLRWLFLLLRSGTHRGGSRVKHLIENWQVKRRARVNTRPKPPKLKAATLVGALPKQGGVDKTVVHDEEQDQPHVHSVGEGEGINFSQQEFDLKFLYRENCHLSNKV